MFLVMLNKSILRALVQGQIRCFDVDVMIGPRASEVGPNLCVVHLLNMRDSFVEGERQQPVIDERFIRVYGILRNFLICFDAQELIGGGFHRHQFFDRIGVFFDGRLRAPPLLPLVRNLVSAGPGVLPGRFRTQIFFAAIGLDQRAFCRNDAVAIFDRLLALALLEVGFVDPKLFWVWRLVVTVGAVTAEELEAWGFHTSM